jgi:pimeloyl-ACP methyl ester carboxylesterase
MNPVERFTEVNGRRCRIWEAGQGEPLFYLPGLSGFPKWPPILDRLAASRRVIVPSLPGFPGGEGHDLLDHVFDWVLAAEDVLRQAGLDGKHGADLAGVSVGGALAAEVAALWPSRVRKLVLVSPYGLFDAAEPVADVFALRPKTLAQWMCVDPARFEALVQRPEGADEMDWQVMQARAAEAAARLLWPLGNTGLVRRLGRIKCPALIVWGEQDRVIPSSYARRFAEGIAGPVEIALIAGAGHLADLDTPAAVADAMLEFLAQPAEPARPMLLG